MAEGAGCAAPGVDMIIGNDNRMEAENRMESKNPSSAILQVRTP
jgi:hypothetical protein